MVEWSYSDPKSMFVKKKYFCLKWLLCSRVSMQNNQKAARILIWIKGLPPLARTVYLSRRPEASAQHRPAIGDASATVDVASMLPDHINQHRVLRVPRDPSSAHATPGWRRCCRLAARGRRRQGTPAIPLIATQKIPTTVLHYRLLFLMSLIFLSMARVARRERRALVLAAESVEHLPHDARMTQGECYNMPSLNGLRWVDDDGMTRTVRLYPPQPAGQGGEGAWRCRRDTGNGEGVVHLSGAPRSAAAYLADMSKVGTAYEALPARTRCLCVLVWGGGGRVMERRWERDARDPGPPPYLFRGTKRELGDQAEASAPGLGLATHSLVRGADGVSHPPRAGLGPVVLVSVQACACAGLYTLFVLVCARGQDTQRGGKAHETRQLSAKTRESGTRAGGARLHSQSQGRGVEALGEGDYALVCLLGLWRGRQERGKAVITRDRGDGMELPYTRVSIVSLGSLTTGRSLCYQYLSSDSTPADLLIQVPGIMTITILVPGPSRSGWPPKPIPLVGYLSRKLKCNDAEPWTWEDAQYGHDQNFEPQNYIMASSWVHLKQCGNTQDKYKEDTLSLRKVKTNLMMGSNSHIG
ncbi:hypothetical protein B0H17DRAFT_1146196 [Mycena rosella]|uniref:Uncharacterized protein n=1 Tax=Mycena rosella TaxID=1033263 RepID=A0AAD7CPC5_MYCRO|nr:hypothetical protein B0H17DRAFT_1146196 [Mycena rosella]